MSETIPERTPEQIIGHDNLMQLIFEGYEVVRAGAILSERDRATAAERAACAERYREGAGPNTWDYFEEAENAINPKH